MKRSGTGYGDDYEEKISEAMAKSLLEKAGFTGQLKMGNEACIKAITDISELRSRLVIQNVSGSFYLASTNYPKDDWKSKFGVDIDDLKNWNPETSHPYPEVPRNRLEDPAALLMPQALAETLRNLAATGDGARHAKQLLEAANQLDCLQHIHEELNGQEWTADSFDNIAGYFSAAGLDLEDCNEFDEPEHSGPER